MLARAAFWGSVAALAYAFVAYPLVVLVRAQLRPRPYLRLPITPRLTVIIAAHNEAAVIGRKLDALLGGDYPADCLQVIVASDGSDDATVRIVGGLDHPAITVLDLPRRGKAQTLNEAVEHATGEILVFTDANSVLATDALRHLVSPFADSAVGGVAGNQVYRRAAGDAGTGELAYWDIDRRMKFAESSAGSAVSATGALYAIRRELFQSIPDGVTDDFITSARIVAQGRRLVFVSDAIAIEEVASTSGAEFARKVRVMTRGLRGVLLVRGLLNPARHGFYAVQLFSEKVMKRLSVLPLLAMLAAGALMWHRAWIYRVTTIGQLSILLAGAIGVRFQDRPLGRLPFFSLPAYFCMANAAALLALRNVLTGRRLVQWRPARSSSDGESNAID
jgi:cellulose synthase/poly-beta-1,6-N-acetylglucosamine synthase-like glycosyltransferase